MRRRVIRSLCTVSGIQTFNTTDQHLCLTDKFDDASGNYTQIVSINGQQIATLSTSDGQAQGWGSAVECAEDNCGTMAAHKWIDTTLTLDTADPNYDQTMGKAQGVTGEMSTSDGGVTWTVTDIDIPAFTFGQS